MNHRLSKSPVLIILCFGLLSCVRDEPAKRGGDLGVESEIHDFVDQYFSTWSDQKMYEYRELFLPDAVVHFKSVEGKLTTYGREDFVQGQVAAHQRSPERMREIPLETKMLASADGRSVLVTVRWKLFRGEEEDTGYDHFTLVRDDRRWRIAYLLFYVDAS